MNIIVGVSDAKTSVDPRHVLATFALGSCIGVALYDPVARVAGLLHFQLPSAAAMPGRAAENPLMFADTGMDWLLREMAGRGAVQARLTVKLAGAAEMFNDHGLFAIGRKNHTAIRRFLWKQGMFIDAEHVGGTAPRTVYLSVADGSLTIRQATGLIAA